MPVDGRVNSKFGPRIDPVTKKSGDFHRGIDIMAPIGEPIKSAKAGEIYENSANRWWGNYIIVKHSENLFTYYCHQSRTKARKGQQVAAGELIGYVGKTGKATGPHLHFEVRVGKDPKDPLQYLK
jgi:murein DD-endopeptidase MepM/ murein hydrolase activator NlpD